MDVSEALEIIRPLANGIDPQTGEVFPPDSPYHHPQTIRALFTAIITLQAQPKPKKKRDNLPEKSGKPWTEEEQKRLLSAFDSGKKINELAREHKRTRSAIRARLVRAGKIKGIYD